MENFEKCTVAMLGGPCSQHVTGNTSRQNQPQSAIMSHNAVVKGRCARDAIPWTFHIEVFECGQDNSDTITRIGDDSVELLDSC